MKKKSPYAAIAGASIDVDDEKEKKTEQTTHTLRYERNRIKAERINRLIFVNS